MAANAGYRPHGSWRRGSIFKRCCSRTRTAIPAGGQDHQTTQMGFHVAEIPYVDVIALDRGNLAIMNRYTRDLPTVRHACLVQNGDVEALIRAIEALPRVGE